MIHRISIWNFKSLRDVIVELSPVTVFVGRSGAGKTNFCDAIAFLRDYVAGRQAALPEWSQSRCATNAKGSLRFEIEFEVPAFPERFIFQLELTEADVNRAPVFEKLILGKRTLYCQGRSEQGRPAWNEPPLLVDIPKPGALAIRRLPGIEEVVMAFTALTTGLGIYSFPMGVLAGNSDEKLARGFTDNGGNFLHVLRELTVNLHHPESRKSVVAALRQINATIESVNLDSIQAPTKVLVGHRLGDKTLPLDLAQESSGFRRFYAHLLALYQTPAKQTLVFEEPENGIFPGALSLLADEFQSAPDAGRGQVLLTTHSPALLDHFEAEQIRVVQLDDNLETRIGPLASAQREALAEQLLHAGELLTVDPARLDLETVGQ